MSSTNTLYPIFLKLHQLNVLVVGGGDAGSEKLRFMLKNSPNAKVTLVAPEISDEIKGYDAQFDNLVLKERAYSTKDLWEKDLVIVATDSSSLNKYIWHEAKSAGILTNVADTPDLCDFYLGSIVTKGDLKVAISTNGKSPTFAKRFRQLLEEILPAETPELLKNLRVIRDRLKGDFAHKVKELDQLTSKLIADEHSEN